MTTPPAEAYSGGNRILDRLPAGERAAIASHLTVLGAEEPSDLLQRHAPIDSVVFPIDAVFSVVVELRGGHAYEVATVGHEGTIGAELVLGMNKAARSVLCQIGGRYARMLAGHFLDAVRDNARLRDEVQRSLVRQWLVSQQTVACNFAHRVEQRAARWILMTYDQVGRSEFALRREYLSIMLGLPTSMIDEPMAALATAGAIRYDGKVVVIMDRRRLVDAVCECYGTNDVLGTFPY
jgi:CRP-like cAMP-binding protein